jgi:hypothetical protein
MTLLRVCCVALLCFGWGDRGSYGGQTPLPPCNDSKPIDMREGRSKAIQYTDWSCQHWSANLQPVSWQVHLPAPLNILSDPGFHDVGLDTHDDKWIKYIGWDGNHWAAQCRAHDSGDKVTFTFEHFKPGHLNKADYEDQRITFIAWDGSDWYLTAPPVSVPEDQQQAIPVYFKLKRRH